MPGLILDLGGGRASFLADMFPEPQRILHLDIRYDSARQARQSQAVVPVVVADGTRLPLADRSIGLTICNSTIEHVPAPAALAAEIRRVSHGYFVQTPHAGFPLELHSAVPIPFYSLLPCAWLRRQMCWLFGADFGYVDSVQYLSERQLRRLFPEAAVAHERMLGLKKSMYVYHAVEEA